MILPAFGGARTLYSRARVSARPAEEDRKFKLPSSTTSEYGRYANSLRGAPSRALGKRF